MPRATRNTKIPRGRDDTLIIWRGDIFQKLGNRDCRFGVHTSNLEAVAEEHGPGGALVAPFLWIHLV